MVNSFASTKEFNEGASSRNTDGASQAASREAVGLMQSQSGMANRNSRVGPNELVMTDPYKQAGCEAGSSAGRIGAEDNAKSAEKNSQDGQSTGSKSGQFHGGGGGNSNGGTGADFKTGSDRQSNGGSGGFDNANKDTPRKDGGDSSQPGSDSGYAGSVASGGETRTTKAKKTGKSE